MSKHNPEMSVEFLLSRAKPMPNGCIEWQMSRRSGGYGQVANKGKPALTHRLMTTLVYGQPEGNLFALHSCDNPPCINPEHLRWGTHAENMADKKIRNREVYHRGEQHPHTQLTTALVLFMRAEYASGKSYIQIARETKMPYQPTRRAIKKITWQHI